mgnify:CR=1 FL=1
MGGGEIGTEQAMADDLIEVYYPEEFARNGTSTKISKYYVVDVSEFESFDGGDLIGYAFYRCFNRVPYESEYELFLNRMENGDYEHEEAKRLFVVCNVMTSGEFGMTKKRLAGFDEYCKRLKKEGRINRAESLSIWFIKSKGKIGPFIFEHIIHPVWMLLPYETRQNIKKKLGRK